MNLSPSLLSSKLIADTLVLIDLAEDVLDNLAVLGVLGAGALDCFVLVPRIIPLLTLAYLRYTCDKRPSFHSIVVELISP